MNFLSRAFSLEDEGKLRKLTCLRLVLATLLIGAAILVLELHDSELPMVALYSLLGVTYLSTGSAYIAFRAGVPFRPLLVTQLALDLAIFTMIVHYSGGSTSYFAILYILPIIFGGIYFQVTGGLLTAIFATAIYIIYSVLELDGRVLSPLGQWFIEQKGVYVVILRGYLHMVVFVFAGLVSGYVSKHIQCKGKELADRERELQRIQLSTDKIIGSMSSGLIVTDMNGAILTFNRSAVEILGLGDGDALTEKGIKDVILHMPVLLDELSTAIETGQQRRRHELEVRKMNGDVLPLGLSISILKGATGRREGVIALFQDLTEVHVMREKVRQADKMAAIGKLSASIAHEIRAPLASICGSIEMLSSELEVSGDEQRLMQLIVKESDRLDRIITDFLEFARIKKPFLEEMDVERCLGEVLMLIGNSTGFNRKIDMRIVNEVESAVVNADEEQIKQVFLNLGLNACQAMHGGGTLNIRIRRSRAVLDEGCDRQECIAVDFANDGPAISENVLPRIFEPFYTTKHEGTGLGLAIAAKIIESHAGLIGAESSEKTGTVFSVVLPMRNESAAGREEQLQESFVEF